MILFSACSSAEKKPLVKGEYIHRSSDEWLFTIPKALYSPRPPYPWENRYVGKHPKITKEFFRCKGCSYHPLITYEREGYAKRYFRDCGGKQAHSLPLREDREYAYPALLEILNFIQAHTEKRVVITSAHHCPIHHAYLYPQGNNLGAKHLLGAEVDFYVEGLEYSTESILSLIQEYYAVTPNFKEHAEFTQFKRYEQGSDTEQLPWFNKEIFIKIHTVYEGRDFDNNHPYPYLTLQLRYDRETKKPLIFDPRQTQNFHRN